MKVFVRKAPLKLILKWTQRVLFSGAILLLSYCVFVLGDTWLFQHRQQQTLDRLLREAQSGASVTRAAVSPSAAGALPVRVASFPPPAVGPDGLIGRMEIPRLSMSVVLVEGTSGAMLRRAAGHIAGTGLPGQPGNIGIAAHRDTFFRPLRNIAHGDIITITTLGGGYSYRVVSTIVVDPYDVAVLNPNDGSEILTLVTCYPFYFVGAAPRRFIVRAERIL